MNNVSASGSRRTMVIRLIRLAVLTVALGVAIRSYNDKQVAGMALAALLALVAFFRIGDLTRNLPNPPLAGEHLGLSQPPPCQRGSELWRGVHDLGSRL